jgi:hypothetical protein
MPTPVIAAAPSASSPETAMPSRQDAGDAARVRIDQEAWERAVEVAKLDPSKQEGQRQTEQLEAARQDAARQEAARAENARLEAERQEAARQAADLQEAARQVAARQEAALLEAGRLEAERQDLMIGTLMMRPWQPKFPVGIHLATSMSFWPWKSISVYGSRVSTS